MAHEVTMPQMGYDMTEGTINEWRVKEGEKVARGDVIASIATDKADIDIEAYADGVLRKIVVQPGQTVPVGTVIAWIGEPGEEVPAGTAGDAPLSGKQDSTSDGADAREATDSRTAARRERSAAAQAPANAGGNGGPSAPEQPDPAPLAPAPREAGAAPAASEPPVPDAAPLAPAAREADVGPSGNGRIKASPYARKRAAELGIDLADVRGSGPGGRIVAQDVERAVGDAVTPPTAAPAPATQAARGAPTTAGAAAEATPAAEAAPRPPVASGVSADDDPYTEAEPSRLRRALARAMVEAKTTVPHFYLTVDVDAAALLRLRAEVNELGPEVPKLSLTDLLVRACALTLQSHPQLNAGWFDGKIRRFERSNVAVAVALADGLIAPTLRNIDRMSMRELAEHLHDLVARAKSNRLRQEEVSGGHMAVSNLGMFDIEEFAAIITPPQSSVLAVGGVRETPVVVDGTLTPGKRMRMTLAVDHRVTDGAQGAEALGRIRWLLEHPAALLV